MPDNSLNVKININLESAVRDLKQFESSLQKAANEAKIQAKVTEKAVMNEMAAIERAKIREEKAIERAAIAAEKAAAKQTAAMEKAAAKQAAAAEKAAAKAKQSGGLSGALKGVAGSIGMVTAGLAAAGAAVAGATAFIKSSIADYRASETAVLSLNNALAYTGQYSKENSDALMKFSSDIQRTTTYEDDQVKQLMASLQAKTGVTRTELESLTKTAIGLADTYGIDVQTAFTAVAKAQNGNVTALGKLGIKIKDINELTARQNELFEASIKLRDTDAGKMAAFANTYGDFKEQVGEAFSVLQAQLAGELLPVLESVMDWFTENRETILKVMRVIGSVIASTFKTIIDIYKQVKINSEIFWESAFVNPIKIVQKLFQSLLQIGSTVFAKLGQLMKQVLAGDFKGALNTVDEINGEIINGIKTSIESTSKLIDEGFSAGLASGKLALNLTPAYIMGKQAMDVAEAAGEAWGSDFADGAEKEFKNSKMAPPEIDEEATKEMIKKYTANLKLLADKAASEDVISNELNAFVNEDVTPFSGPKLMDMRIKEDESDLGPKDEEIQRLIRMLEVSKEIKNTLSSGITDAFGESLKNTLEGSIDLLFEMEGGIKNLAQTFSDMAISIIKDLAKVIAKALVFAGIMAVVNSLTGGTGSVFKFFNNIFGSSTGGAVPAMAFGGLTPPIHAATGYYVSGSNTGRDSVHAMLMPGEYVMRKDAVDRIGTNNLDRLNDGRDTGSNGTTNVYIQYALGDTEAIADLYKRGIQKAQRRNDFKYKE